MTAPADGRRAKGEARRQELVDAALVILERDGTSALTHRAIAAEAGVPLASASYHFAGIDDLILTALLRANRDLVEALEQQTAPPSIESLAAFMADDIRDHRRLYIAYYELYLQAARRPEHRDAATEWLDLLVDHFAAEFDAPQRTALQATIEGLCLHAVVRDDAPSAEHLAEALTLSWPRR